MKSLNVLVRLHQGYGLGDAVQMSAVLRHVARYRPWWRVDYCADKGKEKVGRGIVANTFAYGEPYPSDRYDAEVLICLYDTWANWHDRPNTRVSSALHECFGLPWDAECGRYRVDVSRDALERVVAVTSPMVRRGGIVAVHYQGDSSQGKKNLAPRHVLEVCDHVEALGRIPLILDWRRRSTLPFPHLTAPEWWGGDAEMVCALISQCEAFVGIDSGPSKCASATNTPALVTWTGHHPAPFHDPAPNTTHLVPAGYHGLEPVCGDPGVIAWFEAHHAVRQYAGDPVGEIKRWLEEVLE